MIEIQLFGPPSVRVDGHQVTDLSRKQSQVLTILALHADMPVSKEWLADMLWEGVPPSSYVGTLESNVCVVRRRLGLSARRGGSQLATTNAGFMLSTDDDLVVDLARFRGLARSVEHAGSVEVMTTARQALDLVGGELLADQPYAGWAVQAREAFRLQAVDLWVQGAQRANALGDARCAERLATAVTDLDPLREDAWRQLMVAAWFDGRRGSALAAYTRLRAAMAELVGDEPCEETRELYLTILRDVPAPGRFSPNDQRAELQTLLSLLRQTIDCIPGMHAPARDSALSEVAVRAIAAAF